MKHLERFIALILLVFAIGFNLWLYRAEPTAMVDPNDNAFQYALVERTNVIWDYADRTCPQGFFRLLPSVTCHLSLLIDHWVPNWAEGYNLPYYYSHIPQIAIVGTYRFIHWASQFSIFNFQFSNNFKFQILNFKLFEYYHWIIYVLLCFFPLSVFLSIRLLKFSWLTAGIGALLASHISTDGLYGIDPPSFLWRGWGLSSQLFAMIFMPLALAYIIRVMNSKYLEVMGGTRLEIDARDEKDMRDPLRRSFSEASRTHDYIFAILFITLTTMGHLGMGLMLFFTLPVIAFTQPLVTLLNQGSFKTMFHETKTAIIHTLLLALPPLFLLSYWIIPTVFHGAYHNVSFWDPIWKFNSYGAKEVLVNLWNGYLFDWGRLPIYTILVFIGFFACLKQKTEDGGQRTDNFQVYPQFSDFRFPLSVLSFLFIFFLLLYFGKTTWGGILDFIPGMNEFHQHRFIVGVHLIGLFLAPIGITYIAHFIMLILHKFQIVNLCISLSLSLCICYLLYPQTISYGTYNQTLIKKANAAFSTQKADADLLLQTLRELIKDNPGRVFAGRGGGWGKNFQVAESSYFMYLSTYGIPIILWLPETWSLNSDTEQYFSEDNPSHYELFNVRYVVGPPDIKPQSFWTLIKETDHWKLYEIQTTDNRRQTTDYPSSAIRPPSSSGYITAASSPSVVFSDKLSFANVVRLWIQSPYPEKDIFPELQITGKNPASQGLSLRSYIQLPHFSMLDEANYITPDGKTHSLFQEPPKYVTPWEWPETFPQYQISNINPISNFNNQFPISQQLISIINQSSDTDMVFKTKVEIKEKCPTCVVILKQTYHPNWRVTVNGKPVKTISVFPFYTAIRLEEPGNYEVVFTYTPSPFKIILLVIGIFLTGYFFREKLFHTRKI